jgi:hypothetical protein
VYTNQKTAVLNNQVLVYTNVKLEWRKTKWFCNRPVKKLVYK